MSNTVNAIAHSYKGKFKDIDLSEGVDSTKALLLEETLINICEDLAKVENITGNKQIDVEYILGIVGSYLFGIQDGSLDKETTEPPSKIFEISLFPALQNLDSEIETTVIEEDEELDYTEDTSDDEGHVTEETPDLRA